MEPELQLRHDASISGRTVSASGRTTVTSERSYTYMEHRWGHRRAVSRPVQLQTRGGIAARGQINNVSISGAFVTSALPVALYSYVQVEFAAMLHGKRTHMVVEGQVVRKDNVGFGIEWCEFAPDAVRALVLTPPVRVTDPTIILEPQKLASRVR